MISTSNLAPLRNFEDFSTLYIFVALTVYVNFKNLHNTFPTCSKLMYKNENSHQKVLKNTELK